MMEIRLSGAGIACFMRLDAAAISFVEERRCYERGRIAGDEGVEEEEEEADVPLDWT